LVLRGQFVSSDLRVQLPPLSLGITVLEDVMKFKQRVGQKDVMVSSRAG